MARPRWDRYEAWHPWVLMKKLKYVKPGIIRKPLIDISIEEYRKRAAEFDAMREWIEDQRESRKLQRVLKEATD